MLLKIYSEVRISTATAETAVHARHDLNSDRSNSFRTRYTYRISSNWSRALNTSRASNISRGSWAWFTYWWSLTGLHCLCVISVRHGTIWSYRYFGFIISDCRSEPIIDLLTNVLNCLLSLRCYHQLVINVDVLIKAGLEYKPGLEYRPGVWRNCTNRGRGLLFEEIR